MLPRFSKVQQQTEEGTSVLLTICWGTLELGITLAKKPLKSDFDEVLYPAQRWRNGIAIACMALVHIVVAYFLFFNKTEPTVNTGERRGELIFLNTLAEHGEEKKNKPEKKVQKPQKRQIPRAVASVKSPRPVYTRPTRSPLAAPDDASARIAAARERRQALEEVAAQENQVAQSAQSNALEEDKMMARIKANIEAANYNRKGTNGIFQVLDKGVQTGRFSFRGWTNDPHESTRQTFEVDAGVGGDIELALVRRMIALIREHYSGDFNWDSQRQGRVVVLSARPADTASLERFMMKEFFGTR